MRSPHINNTLRSEFCIISECYGILKVEHLESYPQTFQLSRFKKVA